MKSSRIGASALERAAGVERDGSQWGLEPVLAVCASSAGAQVYELQLVPHISTVFLIRGHIIKSDFNCMYFCLLKIQQL